MSFGRKKRRIMTIPYIVGMIIESREWGISFQVEDRTYRFACKGDTLATVDGERQVANDTGIYGWALNCWVLISKDVGYMVDSFAKRITEEQAYLLRGGIAYHKHKNVGK